MLFSSLLFLLLFLPLVLMICQIIKAEWRNFFLLLASLFFYSWGGPSFLFVLLFSITQNYLFGLLLGKYRLKIFVAISVIFNLLPLFYFKFGNFFIETINWTTPFNIGLIHNLIMPIGISFFTFQGISYILDVYRRSVDAEYSWVNMALYISLFPQLIAGPIVKFHDINEPLRDIHRTISKEHFCTGLKRFVYGLSKKVLIANYMAQICDNIYALPTNSVSMSVAWLAAICYSLQIYYDFSGYSDMAIGIGRMLGFDFLENFNYPYISSSIKEFWRRWHISLSTWFKEYLYIPLGGNRVSLWRNYLNLLIVFFCTGMWHGATWSFIFWGLYHGVFLVVERLGLGNLLEKKYMKFPARIYTLLVVICGWVFFRVEKFSDACLWLKRMFIPAQASIEVNSYLSPMAISLLCIAVLFSGVIQHFYPKLKAAVFSMEKVYWFEVIALPIMYMLCIIQLTASTYNPFIYFRF